MLAMKVSTSLFKSSSNSNSSPKSTSLRHRSPSRQAESTGSSTHSSQTGSEPDVAMAEHPPPPTPSSPGALLTARTTSSISRGSRQSSASSSPRKNNNRRELPQLFWYMELGQWNKALERLRRHPREAKIAIFNGIEERKKPNVFLRGIFRS